MSFGIEQEFLLGNGENRVRYIVHVLYLEETR